MKGLPAEWDVKTKKNVKWVADLGSQSYGNPVVAGGMVFVGTNNELLRDPEAGRRPRRADGVPRVGRRVPLAADARQARVGPRQRLAVPGRRLVAARRGRAALLRQQPRRRLLPRHPGLPRQRERRPGQGREADRPDRRRRHLVVRHDGGGRRVSAQPVELVAGDLGQPALRQHVERPGREPRQHPVAARAVDHRAQQEDRQAGLGGQLGRGSHPARAVVDAVGGHDRRRRPGRVRAGRRLGARLRGGDRQEAVGVRHQPEGFGLAADAQRADRARR